MTQENQQGSPIEEEGGYGTPTAEQEMPHGDAKNFAQPREEEALDAAGLDQDSPEGESSPAGAPDLSGSGDAAVPSTEAEMDSSNTEEPDPGRPFSSEPGQDAAGLPDGSGTDLPESKSPKDGDGDDEESFDAG